MHTKTILVLNGPNLNLLGLREPLHYGVTTLLNINQMLGKVAKEANIALECFQSNSELALLEKVHSIATSKVGFVIINPAAFTHTSIALRDALSAVKVPFIEVHLSNVHARETFRHQSYFSDIAIGVITGLGADGYALALNYAIQHISRS